MSDIDPVSRRYLSSEYLDRNPTWDVEDSPWKAARVRALLDRHEVRPRSIVDVGCGAGVVLSTLQPWYPSARLTGYDIAPAADRFWEAPRRQDIQLVVGDFTATETAKVDVILALDVLEHLQDPYAFLSRLRGRASWYVFHFPLDLSASSVLRESPLLQVHDKVGHIHFFTRRLALALLTDCGYRIVQAEYTGAAFNAPKRGWKTRAAHIPRRLLYSVNRDWGARLLGGETLMVLATSQTSCG